MGQEHRFADVRATGSRTQLRPKLRPEAPRPVDSEEAIFAFCLFNAAEVTEAYSKFVLPPLSWDKDAQNRAPVTLVDQSEGLSTLLPAVDREPAMSTWRSTWPFQAEAVRLYEAGWSLAAIRLELGIAWDSVARLLDRAGVRERRNKSR